MMMAQRHLSITGRERIAIIVSFVIALILAIIPLPASASPFRPDWVALCLIYWAITAPERIGIGTGWLAGLALDILYGTVLGGQALADALLAFLTVSLHLRLRMFPRWQQALAVFGLVAFSHLIILWVRHATGSPGGNWSYWQSDATGALLWPLVYAVLQRLRQASDLS